MPYIIFTDKECVIPFDDFYIYVEQHMTSIDNCWCWVGKHDIGGVYCPINNLEYDTKCPGCGHNCPILPFEV